MDLHNDGHVTAVGLDLGVRNRNWNPHTSCRVVSGIRVRVLMYFFFCFTLGSYVKVEFVGTVDRA